MEKLKVAATTAPAKAAGAIAEIIRKDKKLEIQAIGAEAVNQTVKAIAAARGYVACNGIDILCRPAFTVINREGNETTVMSVVVEVAE